MACSLLGLPVPVWAELQEGLKGLGAWIRLAMDPRSRRLLALDLSWTRNGSVAYRLLRRLRDNHGVRAVVADGALWYRRPCHGLGLRHQVDPGLCNLVERLSKEAKRRMKGFDLYFPCRCSRPFGHVRRWLEAWKS